jgi:hypothetical protein
MALTRKEIDALALELDDINIRQAADKARADEIKAKLATLPFGSLSAADGLLKVSIQHNRRRDDAAFMQAFPFEKFPELYKPTLDTAAIKNEIAPADLEPFTVESTPKVLVTRFEVGA